MRAARYMEEGHRPNTLLTMFSALLKQDQIDTLTCTDPWGTLVSTEAKRNETRTWPARCSERPIAIHLSKKPEEEVCYLAHFAQELRKAGYTPDANHPKGNAWGLPCGSVIGVAWLSRVWQINKQTTHLIPPLGSSERVFGNYQPGRYVWEFACAYRLKNPIPVRGALGLWKWTPTSAFWDEIQAQSDQLRLQLGQ